MTDPNARLLQRQLFAGAFETELDRQGRRPRPAGAPDVRRPGRRGPRPRQPGPRRDLVARGLGRVQPEPRRPERVRAGDRGAGDLTSHHMRFQGPPGIRNAIRGGVMQEGHLPVMPVEVLETLAPAAGSLQIDATVGGGGHTERILEAASPDGRVLGLDADPRPSRGSATAWRGSATGWSCARRTSASSPRSPPTRASARSTAPCSTSACRRSSSPTATAASASVPAAPSTCASTPARGVPAAGAARDAVRRRARRAVPQLRRGAAAWRIAKAIVEARATAPVQTAEELAGRSWSACSPRQPARAPPDPPRDPRLPGAADRRQRGARRAGGRAPRRGRPAAPGRPPRRPPTTRWRTASSSASSSRRAARLHLPARGPGLRLRQGAAPAARHPPVADPDRGRDHRQPARPERAAPCRRAARGVAEEDATQPARPTDRRPRSASIPATPPRPRRRSPVSKRHSASRRKTYGRRQHELHERQAARPPPVRPRRPASTTSARTGIVDRLAFLDPRTPRLRFATGD